MHLSRDLSCFRGLNWRCDLPAGTDCEELARRLGGAGFSPAHSLPGSVLLRSAEGNEILMVPRTLRAQIRVHYLVEEANRRFTAERVFATLVRSVIGRPPRLP